jgi:hypothetical protein
MSSAASAIVAVRSAPIVAAAARGIAPLLEYERMIEIDKSRGFYGTTLLSARQGVLAGRCRAMRRASIYFMPSRFFWVELKRGP